MFLIYFDMQQISNSGGGMRDREQTENYQPLSL